MKLKHVRKKYLQFIERTKSRSEGSDADTVNWEWEEIQVKVIRNWCRTLLTPHLVNWQAVVVLFGRLLLSFNFFSPKHFTMNDLMSLFQWWNLVVITWNWLWRWPTMLRPCLSQWGEKWVFCLVWIMGIKRPTLYPKYVGHIFVKLDKLRQVCLVLCLICTKCIKRPYQITANVVDDIGGLDYSDRSKQGPKQWQF